jgi:hypothetical protein
MGLTNTFQAAGENPEVQFNGHQELPDMELKCQMRNSKEM